VTSRAPAGLRIADAACREAVARIRALVEGEGGRVLFVGGCVRDAMLGRDIRDVDLEVFGLETARVAALLSAHFPCHVVGAAFPVIKLDGLPLDVATAEDPAQRPEAAALRRDFTLNAMAIDPRDGALVDPAGGKLDLERRVLRHTSARFAEDPLRVLRGMQLVARFDLTPAPETVAVCRGLSPAGLPAERVFEEWRKLLLRGVRISAGLHFLREVGWLAHYPELEALVGCPQDPRWHPEGDVWVHTLHCLDAFAASRSRDPRDDLVVGLAVLCHDLGKPATTREEDGRITSKRHEPLGEALTADFLARLTRDTDLLDRVPRLVGAHLAPTHLYEDRERAGDSAIRRLARRVGSLELLLRVAAADFAGRPPLPPAPFPAGDWLRERARALAVERAAPKPILRGRHLQSMGLAPGPRYRELLDAAYEAQLDGRVSTLDEARALVRGLLETSRGSDAGTGE
jgi:tRNA nucleotidyltransferase (CCA-adding enzyme)